MKGINSWHYSFVLLITILGACSNLSLDDLKIITQKTGILETNCYLVYNDKNNQAAVIDPGDSIDTLISHLEENEVELKYIFFTHCHPDHMYGLLCMNLKEKYPAAKVCFSKEGYDDMFNVVAKWDQVYPEYVVEGIKGNSGWLRLFNMDYEKIGEPDIYIKDDQIFKLGNFNIRIIKTPGHARGSVCFYIQNFVFTGDELMHGKVGGTKISPISSFETQVQSIRKLYSTLPDETIVYPGHGNSTSIGFEKAENQNITMDNAIQ